MESEPPHSVEAEQQLLGAVLTNDAVISKVSGILRDEHFYDMVHQAIYRAVTRRHDAGLSVGPVTVGAMLAGHDGLRQLGGQQYLMRLVAAAVSTFAARDYAEVIVDRYQRRALIAASRAAITSLFDGEVPVSTIATSLEGEVGEIAHEAATKPLFRSFLGAANDALERMSTAFRGERSLGTMTGLPPLDRVMGGLRGGDLTILAGRPSMGKTTIAHCMALRAALRVEGVFFASLEMPDWQLAMRAGSFFLASQGQRQPYIDAVRGNLKEAQLREIAMAYKAHEALPLMTAERECREIPRLRSAARRAKQFMADHVEHGLRLIVVDYVQRIEVPKATSFTESTGKAVDALKTLAMDLDVPVLALAQLNRGVDQRDPPIPELSDLKDSGRLEEDADNVIFAYRPEKYIAAQIDAATDDSKRADLEAAMAGARGKLDLIVAKQRNGPLCTVQTGCDMAINFVGDTAALRQRGVAAEQGAFL